MSTVCQEKIGSWSVAPSRSATDNSETSTKTKTVHKPDVNVHRTSGGQANAVSSPKAVQFFDGF